MLQRSENGSKNKGVKRIIAPLKEGKEEGTEITSKYPVEGSRIVDLQQMSKQMYCNKCHAKLHIGGIKNETTHGIGSYFKVECDKYANIQSIKSGPSNKIPGNTRKTFEINAKLAIGKKVYLIIYIRVFHCFVKKKNC